MINKNHIFYSSISSHNNYCEGIWNGNNHSSYLLGVHIVTAKAKKKFSHAGSYMLDKIFCFDAAEVEKAHLGQVNMINVSSFCGPNGLIWGYDICPSQKELCIPIVSARKNSIPVYDVGTIALALEKLLGTVTKPRFPFFPGSHIPSATKNIIVPGPGTIYAAEGIGVPLDRKRNACLLMEDVGKIPQNIENIVEYKVMILEKLVDSILCIGSNQKVEYKEIFIGIRSLALNDDEFGCAMAVSPYFTIAQSAIPKEADISQMDLDNWEESVKDNFLYKNGTL